MLDTLNSIQRSCQASQTMIEAHTASKFYIAGCEHAIYQLERLEDLTRLVKSDTVHLSFCTANLLNLLDMLDKQLFSMYESAVDSNEWTDINKAIKLVGTMQLIASDMRKTVTSGD